MTIAIYTEADWVDWQGSPVAKCLPSVQDPRFDTQHQENSKNKNISF